MQPTSMATMLEARENVFKEGNKTRDGVALQPGSPRRSISLPGYLVLPLPGCSLQQPDAIRPLSAVSLSACQPDQHFRPFGPSLVSTAAALPCQPQSAAACSGSQAFNRVRSIDDVSCRRRRWFTIVNDR